MWAAQLTAPYHFETLDIPSPKESDLGENQVILQVLAGAICGSDVPMFRGGIRGSVELTTEQRLAMNKPGFPLHEVVGEVIASSSDLKVGEHVVGWAKENDGLAEQIVADAMSLHALSKDSPLPPAEQTIIQPLACVIAASNRLGDVTGKRVTVIGLGAIGLLFAHVMRTRGASRVTGVDPIDRSGVAKTFLVDDCLTMTSERYSQSVAPKETSDIVIEAIGHQVGSLNHAIDAAADEAKVYYFGICDDTFYSVNFRGLQRKNLTLITGTTRIRDRRPALTDAEEYLQRYNDIPENYITDVFDTKDVQHAYERANKSSQDRVKVVINW